MGSGYWMKIELYRGGVAINNHTQSGYILAHDGDGIALDLYRANHRGTVQKGISQTIMSEPTVGVIEIERIPCDEMEI